MRNPTTLHRYRVRADQSVGPDLRCAVLVATLLASLTSACSLQAPTATPKAPSPPQLKLQAKVRTLSTNSQASGRDGGSSVKLGDEILWVFGDTFIGDHTMLSATAAWSHAATPTELHETIDSQGLPLPLYSFTAEEKQFNQSHQEPATCCLEWEGCEAATPYCHCAPQQDCRQRIALWPGDLVAADQHSALNLYESVEVGTAPFDFKVLGTGLARVVKGQTTATRIADAEGNPLLLFTHNEPKFLTTLPLGEWAYVFGQQRHSDCTNDVWIARTALATVAERGSYRFWNGTEWVTDLQAASPILRSVVGGLDSVAWSPALGAYLGVSLGVCTEGASLEVRRAQRPEGPWSEPARIDLAPVGATSQAYAARIHPNLGAASELIVGFYEPLVEENRVVGKIRLVTLDVLESQ